MADTSSFLSGDVASIVIRGGAGGAGLYFGYLAYRLVKNIIAAERADGGRTLLAWGFMGLAIILVGIAALVPPPRQCDMTDQDLNQTLAYNLPDAVASKSGNYDAPFVVEVTRRAVIYYRQLELIRDRCKAKGA